MRNLLATFFVAFAVISSLPLERAFAQTSGKMAAMDHKMDHKEEMKMMMKEKEDCMKENKDNKMCHEKVMASCETKMSKDDCGKMMKGMHDKMKMKK